MSLYTWHTSLSVARDQCEAARAPRGVSSATSWASHVIFTIPREDDRRRSSAHGRESTSTRAHARARVDVFQKRPRPRVQTHVKLKSNSTRTQVKLNSNSSQTQVTRDSEWFQEKYHTYAYLFFTDLFTNYRMYRRRRRRRRTTLLSIENFPRNVTLRFTAPASGALARALRGRYSPSGRQTRIFSRSVTRDSATYREPCAKPGSGMYTATRPLQVCPCDFAMVIANATHTGNCVRRHW